MSLLIATPMYGGQCTQGHFLSCLQLKETFLEVDFPHDWLVTDKESLITRARDTMAARFLRTKYERLLFIDADIDFTPQDVSKLWNLDVPVAVAAYSMKRADHPLSAWREGKLVEIGEETTPFPVDYAGTGFFMIKREVLETLKDHPLIPEYQEGNMATIDGEVKTMGQCWGFFQDPIEDDIHLSEDYFFCKRWRETGGEILMDPTIRLGHWGNFRYGD